MDAFGTDTIAEILVRIKTPNIGPRNGKTIWRMKMCIRDRYTMKRIAAFTICMLIVLSVQLSIDAQVDHKERVVSSESTVDGSDILAPGMTKVDANTRFTLYINRSDGLIDVYKRQALLFRIRLDGTIM